MTPRSRNEVPERLLTVAEAAKEFTMTEGAIRGRISAGHWIAGQHYYRKGRRIRIDPEAIKKWMVTQ